MAENSVKDVECDLDKTMDFSTRKDWLEAEESGQEEPAEMLFARVIANMPPIEPGAEFVERAVQAALRSRARRRRVRLSLAATVLVIAVVAAGFNYALAEPAIKLVVSGFAHGLVWLLTSIKAAAGWWWLAERIGTAVSETIAIPRVAFFFAALGIVGLISVYAFRRLLEKH